MTQSGPSGESGAGSAPRHIPVLCQEVVANLPATLQADDARCIDGTFGAGGYARAILCATRGRVLGIDQDPDVLIAAQPIVDEWAGRLSLVAGNFAQLSELAETAGFSPVDAVVLDIGVSSMQLDDAHRGFSFRHDGPLDMRMAQSGPTAADVLNSDDETRIADILYRYGEERRSRAIARAIVAHRAETPFTRTSELAALVERVIGRRPGDDKHPATRTFQALRVHVNRELHVLADALYAAERVLRPGGRLLVVTFHSLEDRIAKRFLRDAAGRIDQGSRHLPGAPLKGSVQFDAPRFRIVNSRPLTPGKDELQANPRARSAKLRVGERTDAPARDADLTAFGLPDF